MALADSFTVTVNGTDDNPVTEVNVGGSSATLIVENRINYGDTIAVSYTAPATGKITDLFGNELADFMNRLVGNEVLDPNDSTPPTVDDAETDARGREISISFDEDIVALIVPPAVVDIAVLGSGADTANQHRYYLEWGWSPGEGDENNAQEYYQYRYRQVTSPAASWSNYEITERPTVRVNNLLPNAQYEIEVLATNIAGDSAATMLISDTPTVEAGQPPTSLSVINKQRTIDPDTFNYVYIMDVLYAKNPANTEAVTRYEYRYKVAAGSAWTAWTDNELLLSFSIMVEVNTIYDIEVRSVNFIGASSEIAIQDQVEFGIPNAPENLVVEPSRTGTTGSFGYQIKLSWDTPDIDATNTIDNYQYRYKLSSTGIFSDWVELSADATEVTITGLTHSDAYDVEVSSLNNFGESTAVKQSNIVIFQTPPPIPMYDGIVEEIDNMGTAEHQIKWNWMLPATVQGFNHIEDIEYRTRDVTNAWGSWISFGNATTTQYILKNLVDGTTYEIQVRLLNSAGETAPTLDDEQFNVLLDAPVFEINNLQDRVYQVVYFGPDEGSPIKFYQFQYQLVGENTWRPTIGTIIRTAPAVGEIAVWNTDQANPQGIMIRWRGLDTDQEAITEWGQGVVPAVNQ